MTLLLRALRTKGLRGTGRAVGDRFEEWLLERYYEWRLGITTRGTVSSEMLGYEQPDCHAYGASTYGNLRRIIRALNIHAGGRDVLIDFGSGKGRVLVFAALHPFERIIGVERSPQLNVVARQNIEDARARFVCQHVDLVTADAARYEVPDDATIVYFASPFGGTVLEAVLDRMHASLMRAPRRFSVVSHGYDAGNAFERQLRAREWLSLRAEIALQRGHCAWIYTNARWDRRAAVSVA